MDTKERDALRRDWWGRLRCINVMRDDAGKNYAGYNITKDTWYVTTEPDENIHLPDETKHVPRRVEMSTYSCGMIHPAADFFIDHPNAKWLLLHTTRGDLGLEKGPFVSAEKSLADSWLPVVLAWGE